MNDVFWQLYILDSTGQCNTLKANEMAFNDVDLKRIDRAATAFMLRRRPPEHIRPQLDFSYRIENQTIELLEVRPRWDKPSEIMRRPFAKTTYVRSLNVWKVYWMRGNLKWHPYEPACAKSIEEFFALVDVDKCGCFFG